MTELSRQRLLAIDQAHIWHPYTVPTADAEIYPVVAAQGVQLELADGRRLIDGMSSWWTAIHGYNHPLLNQAISDQLGQMAHVMFGGLTHPPAVELAGLLVDLTPAELDQVFFADSGSVAVEVAIKMSMQYWQGRGKPQKHKLLALKCAYHGDTSGAMAVCDPHNSMHALWTGILPQHYFADAPPLGYSRPCDQGYQDHLQQLFARHHQQLAALIIEPVVQGAGGMRIYNPHYLSYMRELCDHYQVLLIADEIATGFGRTGKLFGCEHTGIVPDILCLGKALTGGYLTLAATLTSRSVAEAIGNNNQAFMHGPTFMANALACAVATASLGLLQSSAWQTQVTAIEQQLAKELAPCRELSPVADVRVLGAIGVLQMKQPVDQQRLQRAFVDQGVWIRPFANLVYIMPPYIINQQQLSRLTGAIYSVIACYGG
jgi:adenosylmethionine-8-amino-7-oxononanoate aminotransferase